MKPFHIFTVTFEFLGSLRERQCVGNCTNNGFVLLFVIETTTFVKSGRLPSLNDVPFHMFVNPNLSTSCDDYVIYGRPCSNQCTPSCRFWLNRLENDTACDYKKVLASRPRPLLEICPTSSHKWPLSFLIQFNLKSGLYTAFDIDMPLMASKVITGNETVVELSNAYYDLRQHCFCAQRGTLTHNGQILAIVNGFLLVFMIPLIFILKSC